MRVEKRRYYGSRETVRELLGTLGRRDGRLDKGWKSEVGKKWTDPTHGGPPDLLLDWIGSVAEREESRTIFIFLA